MGNLYTLFDDVPPSAAEHAASLFEGFEAEPDTTVATEGEHNDAMLFIESGEVAVIAGGFEVARMTEGAIIGEIGLFAHAVRTATVKTVSRVGLQRLTRARFVELRNHGNPIAYRIERRAIQQLVGRIRQLIVDLGEVAVTTPSLHAELPEHTVPSPDEPFATPEQVAHLLRRLPGFSDGPPDALKALALELRPVRLARGERVDPDAAAGLLFVVSGAIEALGEVGSLVFRIATANPGEAVDVLHHVDGQERPARLHAVEPTEALRLPTRALNRLLFADDLTGSTLRIALIRGLADQVNQINGTFSLARLLSPATEAPPAARTATPGPSVSAKSQTSDPAPLRKL